LNSKNYGENTMVESFKYKSKITTAVSFLAALVVYLGRDGLAEVMPAEYAYLIPIIVFCAGYVATQQTENIRVATAEQMVHEEYSNPPANDENVVVNLTLDGEDVIKDNEEEAIINEDEAVINEEEEESVDDGGC